jgi:hypothetical protein
MNYIRVKVRMTTYHNQVCYEEAEANRVKVLGKFPSGSRDRGGVLS